MHAVATPALAPPGTIRALAWEHLAAAAGPVVGDEAWARIADEAGGPRGAARDPFERGPLAPFLDALALLGRRHGEAALRATGAGFARAWAGSYRSLVGRLRGDPRGLVEVLAEEALPWLLAAPRAARVLDAGPASLVVEVRAPLPAPFVEGLLAGAAAQAGAGARVARDGARFALTWEGPARPSPARVLLRAARPAWLAAAVVPVAVGAALAWRGGYLAPPELALTFLGVALLQVGSGMANDYFDHRSRADEANPTPTPFSGGSRLLQQEALRPRTLLALAALLVAAGAAVGLLIATRLQALHGAGLAEVLAFGGAGVALGLLYTAPPVSLASRGLGELAVGLGFGPLLVGGTYLVQRTAAGGGPTLGWEAAGFGLPVGALVAAMLLLHEVPDAPWDARVGKRTLAVRLGGRAVLACGALLALAYATLAAAAVLSNTWPALLALATAPLAAFTLRHLARHRAEPYRLLPANATAVALVVTTSLLLVAGLVLARGPGGA